MNELAAARAIAEGRLQSPHQLDNNLWLVGVRITGTGTAVRPALAESVFRDPARYLNREFLERCNGLPVVVQHPEGLQLTDRERVVGTIMHAFVKHPLAEVWGVMRCNDRALVDDLATGKFSTSPSIVLAKGQMAPLPDGSVLHVESEPLLLDHLALVPTAEGGGVWDRAGKAGIGVKGDSALAGTNAHVPSVENHDHGEEGDPAGAPEVANRKDDGDAPVSNAEMREMRAMLTTIMRRLEAVEPEDDDNEGYRERNDRRRQKRHDNDRRRADSARTKREETEENERLALAHQAADQVCQLWGKRASSPFDGEDSDHYRRRVLQSLKAHSSAYKDADLHLIGDEHAFAEAEQRILADSAKLANSNDPAVCGPGLREVRQRDPSGREIIRFFGSVAETLAPFRYPPMRATFDRDLVREGKKG